MAAGKTRRRSGLAEAATPWSGEATVSARAWQPYDAAREVLSPGQARRLRQGLALLAPFAFLQPVCLLGGCLVAVTVLLLVGLGWRATLIARGLRLRRRTVRPGVRMASETAAPPSSAARAAWPTYTLLVALYRESAALPGLAAALNRLDWPRDRLEILLCVEQDDRATRKAVDRCAWPLGTRYVVAPPGAPRTKPRALNIALREARGTLIGLYDAEDRPHSDQLCAAYAAFRAGGSALGCVQAPLVAQNAGASWLAAHWAADYSVLFGLMVPAQAEAGLPVLLGGTSNHFRRAVLETLDGWDAWNVTEDADLGVRLARAGYRTGVIAPVTLEEAPTKTRTWLPQRSRWLKGFLQTWLILMRAPGEAIGRIGWQGMLTLQVGLIGSVMTALCHAPLTLWWMLSLALTAPGPGTWLGGLCLAAGLAVHGVGILVGAGGPVWQRLALVLTLPAYWALQTLAAGRALYGLVTAPHFWAKTPHYGLPGDLRAARARHGTATGETTCISVSRSWSSPPVSGLPSTPTARRQNRSTRAVQDGSHGASS